MIEPTNRPPWRVEHNGTFAHAHRSPDEYADPVAQFRDSRDAAYAIEAINTHAQLVAQVDQLRSNAAHDLAVTLRLTRERDAAVAERDALSAHERFHAIRLASGEMIYGEFSWMGCDGPDDWTVANESEHDDPTEYEIVEMIVRPVAKRAFGEVETE